MIRQAKNIFFGFIFLVSAICTFGFFYQFVPDIFPSFIYEDLRRAMSGFAGFIMLDAAAFAWSITAERFANTPKQIEIANTMSQTTIITSVMITAAYLIITGFDLSTSDMIVTWAGWIALIGVIGVFAYSFYSLHEFVSNSQEAYQQKAHTAASARQAERAIEETRQAQELKDAIMDNDMESQRQLNDLVIKKTAALQVAEADTLANEQAKHNARQYRTMQRRKVDPNKQEVAPPIPTVTAATSPPDPRQARVIPREVEAPTKRKAPPMPPMVDSGQEETPINP